MYTDIKSLLLLCEKMPIYEAVLANEEIITEKSREIIEQKIKISLNVMRESANRALQTPQEMVGNLISGQAFRQNNYSKNGGICGESINFLMAQAFSCSEVNAAMGRICAAPTAGACGIVPAVLLYMQKTQGKTDEDLQKALLVASGFGAVIMNNATVSGAEGGCQAECGTAAAMAAAAAAFLQGATPQVCAQAMSIAIINIMGLICDPVAGLVQMPCSFRNASGSVNALISADMALAGQTCLIPADEIIKAMYNVGKSLPSDLRETAQGGIAACDTARQIAKELFC